MVGGSTIHLPDCGHFRANPKLQVNGRSKSEIGIPAKGEIVIRKFRAFLFTIVAMVLGVNTLCQAEPHPVDAPCA